MLLDERLGWRHEEHRPPSVLELLGDYEKGYDSLAHARWQHDERRLRQCSMGDVQLVIPQLNA